MSEVIVKVSKMKVSAPYAERAAEIDPVTDILYAIEIPEDGAIEKDGQRIFNIKGIRHIMTQLSAILVIDGDREDF